MINSNSFVQQQFNNYKRQQYSRIYQHELAHKQAGGSLAGPIVIENDKNGIPVAGHVEIKMPQLNTENPDETIKDANTVINSALAPADPSNQDLKVATEAKEILNEAQQAKSETSSSNGCANGECGNKLNFLA